MKPNGFAVLGADEEGGYTLVEAVTAILIIGLAMTAIAAALHVAARTQASTNRLRDEAVRLGRIGRLLASLPDERGPFRVVNAIPVGAFRGDAHSAFFPCGAGLKCSLKMASVEDGEIISVQAGATSRQALLPSGSNASLVYVSDAGQVFASWPVAIKLGRLAEIVVVSDAHVYGVLPFVASQAEGCAFNATLQDCTQ